MESVMNFLADYYIWFFVAALIFSFALIGFIIESKKRQKNEFKGEAIEENKVEENNGFNHDVNNSNIETFNTEINNNDAGVESLDDTMEINDIPINSNPNIQENSDDNNIDSMEFYGGPINMQTPTPKPMPIEEFPSRVDNLSNDSSMTNNVNNNVTYDNVSSLEDSSRETEVKQENSNNFDIFEDLK